MEAAGAQRGEEGEGEPADRAHSWRVGLRVGEARAINASRIWVAPEKST